MFCAGKVYYDLLEERERTGDTRTAIVRVEQLYPFDAEAVASITSRYSDARSVMWVQEEPENRGAWWFIRDRLQRLLGKRTLTYVGREASPSPATGSHNQHEAELKRILDTVFG